MRGFLEVYGYPDKSAPTGYNIATVPQQLITSFLNVGTIIGVLLAAVWANYLGRRPAIWCASLVSCVAAGLQVGTTNLVGIYFGRILIGVSNGFYITFGNVWIAEAAPAHLRVGIVAFFGIWVSTGSILGALANNFANPLGGKLSYQIPLASLFAIPVALAVVVTCIPESPRWLLMHGQVTKARRALERLRGDSFGGNDELLEEEFQEMVRGIDHEKELASRSALLDMFRGSDLHRTLLCYAVIVSHSGSGVWMVIAFGVCHPSIMLKERCRKEGVMMLTLVLRQTFFFQMAGISVKLSFIMTILKSVCGLSGVIVSILLAQRWLGRRPMMLLGHGMAALFLLGAGIAGTIGTGRAPENGKAIVACVMVYYFFYNGFSGAISWPVSNELVSSRLRVVTMATGTAINYFFSCKSRLSRECSKGPLTHGNAVGLISFTAPYFLNKENLNWGAKYAYIWAGSNFITFGKLMRFHIIYYGRPTLIC